jgi:hypothetical protein
MTDRMPRYIPARNRIVPLNRYRGAALLEFVRKLADGGDQRAMAFYDALMSGAFDPPPDGGGDTGIRLNPRPSTVRPGEP